MAQENNSLDILGPARIGSPVVMRGDSLRITSSIIKGKITRLTPLSKVERSMSGESVYVYNDSMNQGSLGVSGSYGFSGVSKITSSLSAYLGRSKASSTKSISMYYNIKTVNGFEYIAFNDLKPEDIMNAMDAGPKGRLIRALDAHVTLSKVVGGRDILEIMKAPNPPEDVMRAFKEWSDLVNQITSSGELGDGMVVGILWGAIGEVSLNIFEAKTEDTWKYGGKGSFSYGGLATSISVEAAYDGSQASRRSSVKMNVDSTSLGNAIANDTNEWFKTFANKGFNDVAGVSPLKEAPTITASTLSPTPPPFNKPEKDPGLASKIGQITNMEGLKTMAIAAAYDEAKKKDGKLTLADFMKQSESPVNTSPLQSLADGAAQNTINPNLTTSRSEEEPETTDERSLKADDPAAFVPLGIWICNWADLFPWLYKGNYNGLDDLGGVSDILGKEAMIQDFLAISRMYRIFNTYNIPATDYADDMPDFIKLADAFDSQVAGLQEATLTPKAAYAALGPMAKQVYDHWKKTPVLRNAELGLGLVYNKKSIKDSKKATIEVPGLTSTYHTIVYDYENIDIGATSINFQSFAKSVKLFPLLLPNGKIYAYGPENTLLKRATNDGVEFIGRARAGMELIVEKNYLVATQNAALKLYPIPVTAATNVEWRGQGLSLNLGSMKTLQQKLDAFKAQFQKLTRYTFSTPSSPSDYYRMNSINAQYIGITEKIAGDFDTKK